MGDWSSASKSHVSSMTDGDFFGSEASTTIASESSVRIEHVGIDGQTTILKSGLPLQAGEVIDSCAMSVKALRTFLSQEIDAAMTKMFCSPCI